MEDALLDIVLSKISETLRGDTLKGIRSRLLRKIKLLPEVEFLIKVAENELVQLQVLLSDETRNASEGELEKIRAIAGLIENIIDEYAYLLGQTDDPKISDWINIAFELRESLVRVPKSDSIRNSYTRQLEQSIDGTNQNEEKNRLIQWLTDSVQLRTIISIWGTRGLSKTTLARQICGNQEIKNNFNCYAWASVSQSKSGQVLRSILNQLKEEAVGIPEGDLVATIQSLLQEKKYLIVLDDVPSREVWTSLHLAFPMNNCGSKVVLTTRFEEVASLADNNCAIKTHSFSDLPNELRSCFLYCGLFPKDYVLKSDWIIGLWIAEGFVQDGKITKEQLAECYLKELVDYSHLQVIKKNICGRIKQFKVHDFVRETALITSKNEKFGVVLDGSNVTEVGQEVRRLFVQKGNEPLKFSEASRQLRSFILFDKELSSSWIIHASSNFKLLQVLCLRSTKIKMVPNAIYQLNNLHCLDLASTGVKEIKSLVKNLKKLQRLDLSHTYVTVLPKEIKMLRMLRHLIVIPVDPSFSAGRVTVDICELVCLQTLKKIEANYDLVMRLGNLTKIRNLSITNVRRSFIRSLWDSLSNMPALTTLGIAANDKDVLSLESVRPHGNLEKLYLKGRLEEIAVPSIFGGFGMMKDLRMVMSGLKNDPLPFLSQMNNLVNLHLESVYEGNQLTFCREWFPNLRKLHLFYMTHLSCIIIEPGTMTSLQHLQFSVLSGLTEVPKGIRHLQTLEEIALFCMPKDFMQRLIGCDKIYVDHVRKITY